MTYPATPALRTGRPSTPAALPEMRAPQPRIFRIMFRSAYTGSRITVFAKVPYGGVFALTEVLTRALTTGEIEWFRLDKAKPKEVTPRMRSRLQRWPEALRSTSPRSGVTWLV